MLEGVYIEPPTTVLQYEALFLAASLQYPEMPGTPAERKLRAVRHYPRLAKRPLHECLQDIVDEALASGSERMLGAALDYIQLRQRYLMFLFECPVGLKYDLALDVQIGSYWQSRIHDAIDGTKSRWIN